MSPPVPPQFVPSIHRLALGIEPVDALSGGRVPPPLRVARDDRLPSRDDLRRLALEGEDLSSLLPPLTRHPTCRYVLRYGRGAGAESGGTVDVRLFEGPVWAAPRRFVPRRFRVPLLDPDEADGRPTGFRVRRPRLFPGAAYPAPSRSTGLRGRVLREGVPERWCRIGAVSVGPGAGGAGAGAGTTVARAHGDDRGEFLLLLGPEALPFGPNGGTLTLRIRVFAPPAPDGPGPPGSGPGPTEPEPPEPTPGPGPGPADAAHAILASVDPLWDLPVEELPEEETAGAVALGHELPQGYALAVERTVHFTLGRVHSEAEAFEIPG